MRVLASLWDLWSAAIAERNKSHSLALPALGRFERLFGKQKDFQVWRGKAGSIDNIGESRYLAVGRLL